MKCEPVGTLAERSRPLSWLSSGALRPLKSSSWPRSEESLSAGIACVDTTKPIRWPTVRMRLTLQNLREDVDAAGHDVGLSRGEAQANMGWVGAKARSGRDEQTALDTVLEQALQATLVEVLGDVHEKESAAGRRRDAEPRGGAHAD